MERKQPRQEWGIVVIAVAVAVAAGIAAGYLMRMTSEQDAKKKAKDKKRLEGEVSRERSHEGEKEKVEKEDTEEKEKEKGESLDNLTRGAGNTTNEKDKEKEAEDEKFIEHVQDVEEVLRVLRLMHGDKYGGKESQGDISGKAEVEEVGFLVAALKVHPENLAVVVGVFTLFNWYCIKSRSQAIHRAWLHKRGMISYTLEAMKRFSDTPALSSIACGVLGNLAAERNHFARAEIAARSGISIILDALQGHRLVVGVQEMGFFVLSNVCTLNDENKELVIKNKELNVIAHVIEMMKEYADVPSLQETACLLLGNLCFSKGARARMGKGHNTDDCQCDGASYGTEGTTIAGLLRSRKDRPRK